MPRINLRNKQEGDYYISDLAEESFRILRTNLQFIEMDKEGSRSEKVISTILVTSPTPRDGKTTVLINLGKIIAEMGKRVLLVDSDLRRPSLHKYFRVENGMGLSDFLAGKADLDSVICQTSIPNLSLLPSGHPSINPSQLLDSLKMKEFSASLKERFDKALFDSPPVLPVTDASILASEVDGVILVIASGKTPRRLGILTKRQLDNARAHILGVVLNNRERLTERHYGYYYHYYPRGKK